jgi:hypothetical protein
VSRHKLTITEYLAMFPDVETRWVNRCVTCDRIGYKPETPNTAKGAYRVKRDLDPLTLDDVGRCPVCANAAARLTSLD